jgi:hypothetical protein
MSKRLRDTLSGEPRIAARFAKPAPPPPIGFPMPPAPLRAEAQLSSDTASIGSLGPLSGGSETGLRWADAPPALGETPARRPPPAGTRGGRAGLGP